MFSKIKENKRILTKLWKKFEVGIMAIPLIMRRKKFITPFQLFVI